MQVRDDDQADGERDLDPEDDLERGAASPSRAPRAPTPVSAGDEQRAVAERAPAQAELLHRAAARLAFERADRRHADEDQAPSSRRPRRSRRAGARRRGRRSRARGSYARASRKSGGVDALVGRLELVERPPAVADDALVREIDRRLRLVRVHTHEVDVVDAGASAAAPRETCARASRRAGRASNSVAAPAPRAARAAAPSRGPRPGSMPPPGVPHHVRMRHRVLVLDEHDALVGVDEQRAHRFRAAPARATPQRTEPAQPLVVRHGCVRGRRRRQHVERRRAERAPLRAELGPLVEETAVGLLADERDRDRVELDRDALEPLGDRSRRVAGRRSRASSAPRRS